MIKGLIIIVAILALSCSGKERENKKQGNIPIEISDSIITKDVVEQKTVEEIPTFLQPMTKHDNKTFKRREDIDKLIHDTISNVRDKFESIFSNDLLNNSSIEFSYINDSIFNNNPIIAQEKESSNYIKDYSSLKDSIANKRIDLDSNSIIFLKDDISYFAFKFKNGDRDTIKWDPNEWGAYEFGGYFLDVEYYWIQQIDHGESNYFINVNNGDIIDFLPHYSINKTYYHDISSFEGYGDASYIQLVLGKELLTPDIDIIYEYSPFLVSSEYYSKFGFNNFNWISDGELIFNFYHILTKEYGSTDTLFHDNIGIKINYTP